MAFFVLRLSFFVLHLLLWYPSKKIQNSFVVIQYVYSNLELFQTEGFEGIKSFIKVKKKVLNITVSKQIT